MKFKQYKIPPKSGESGFTIIESLIAVVVVSVLMVAIAPVVVFSTATRVQSRRVELAAQAAKTYVEGVRTGAIGAPATGSGVPTVGNLTCNANAYCTVPASPANNLYCIDGDGGGCTLGSNKDFIIQAFRNNANSADATTGYLLGVRVYRADGFQNDGALTAPTTQSTVTAGLGDRKAPLVEINTEITSNSDSFNDLCNRLKDASNTSSNSSCN
ncbi:hormogonium polysaccharide secretion pseudopilin HpsB [Calothrix rhizosoleniae]|uniref:hormogonium polysaccharide secretion pseudopilin HpsB n=1 Tax=Calothrix rhizosoleniae TaxID=888997 RepID=UPI00190E84E9|nr:hormogonium polysaccharide secretion pseudopilin HpsB [Calothrix rhizosoleniae]